MQLNYSRESSAALGQCKYCIRDSPPLDYNFKPAGGLASLEGTLI